MASGTVRAAVNVLGSLKANSASEIAREKPFLADLREETEHLCLHAQAGRLRSWLRLRRTPNARLLPLLRLPFSLSKPAAAHRADQGAVVHTLNAGNMPPIAAR